MTIAQPKRIAVRPITQHTWRHGGLFGPTARRQVIETAAGTAHYLVVGSGPPIIFLHGLDASVRWWNPTIRVLSRHFRCFALDFMTFDYWRERSRVRLPQSGDFVAAWLQALQLDRTHVIAHSMGGYSACQLAIAYPDLIDHLVLVAPAITEQRRLYLHELRQLGPFAWNITPTFVPIFVGDSLRTGPVRWWRAVQELQQAAPLPLSNITAPTLLIWGTRDPLVPVTRSANLQRQIANSRLLLLRGARHVPMYEQPDAFNQAVRAFFAGEAVGTTVDADQTRSV